MKLPELTILFLFDLMLFFFSSVERITVDYSVSVPHWFQCGSGLLKIAIYLSLNLQDVKATGEAFSPQKRTSNTSKFEIS
jgi:hypothetical protein